MSPAVLATPRLLRALKLAAIKGLLVIPSLARAIPSLQHITEAVGARAKTMLVIPRTSGTASATPCAKGRAAYGGVVASPSARTTIGTPIFGRLAGT